MQPSAAVLLSHAQVYHPNIDLEGKICLNILREDWKPVLSISSVIYGLQFLFLVRSRSACCRNAGLACPAPTCTSTGAARVGRLRAALLHLRHLLHPQDPNPEDPLNKEAAKMFQENQRQFQTYVQVGCGLHGRPRAGHHPAQTLVPPRWHVLLAAQPAHPRSMPLAVQRSIVSGCTINGHHFPPCPA